MSVSMIGLLSNWLFEGGFRKKWEINKKRNYAPLLLAIIFLLELFWLFFSEELKPGLSTLRIKLPFFIMAIVFGTSQAISRKELKTIIICFIMGVLVSSVATYLVDLGWINKKTHTGTSRDISIFMSHIRYSIILSFSILLLFFLMIKNKIKKWIGFIISFIIIIPIYKMASLTAIIGLVLGFLILMIFKIRDLKKGQRILILFFMIITSLIGTIKLVQIIKDYYQPKENFYLSWEDKSSSNGEFYIENTNNKMLENGYYVWNHIAKQELKKAWNNSSKLSFDEKDLKGQIIRFTIFRYMTSKGLKKDKQGFSKLTKQDIRLIEEGNTSAVKYNIIEKRVREVLFEIDFFRKTKDPNSHSFTQRILFWKIGLNIFKKAPLFGYGTGGVETQYRKYYKHNPTVLKKENQLYAHNQFLTQIINLGIFLFIIWLVIIVMPIINLYATNKELFLVFSIFMFMALFTDDMFDRQAGVSIFVTIYYLLIFSAKEKEIEKLFLFKKYSK